MDYKTIMEKKEAKTFHQLYEKTLTSLSEYYYKESLSEKMKEKRAFGITKYKELSFQSSLENLIASPLKEHAIEELIDLANYILTYQYASQIKGDFLFEQEAVRKCILQIGVLYDLVNNLRGDF